MTSDRDKSERILDAAEKVVGTRGFPGTTVAAIAEEAGVSRGLLHYYFDSKDDMLARMLRRSTEEAWEIIRRLMAESSSVDDLAGRIVEAMREYARTHGGSLSLLAEGLALARNHPRIRDELGALHREGQDVFSEALERMKADGLATYSMPARGLSTILIALFDGLGLEVQTISGLAADEDTWTAFGETIRRLLT